MPKYRKKPIVIEAFQVNYTPGYNKPQAIDPEGLAPDWLLEALVSPSDIPNCPKIYLHANGLWVVQTLEGIMEILPGSYVIRGVKNELYPCREDIFLATYEPVLEES